MSWLRVFIHRLRGLVLRRKLERELEEEIRAHIDMQMEDNLQRGMPKDEARDEARRKFGGVEQVKESYRDRCGWPIVESAFQDLRYGLRMLRKYKGFTAAAALSLALGIGANTAIFSLIDALLLKTLPVEQPEQLYFIQNVGMGRPEGGGPPYPCFELLRDNNQSFVGMAAFTGSPQRIKIDGRLEEVFGHRVSGNYFSVLGVNAALGRTFSLADDSTSGKGGPDGVVTVISYDYWTNRFGRDPSVIGKVVRIGADPATIIGVAPPRFYGVVPGGDPSLWLPMMTADAAQLAAKESWWLNVVGRVKPGVPLEQARVELDALFQTYMDGTSLSAESRRTSFNRIELRSASRGDNGLRRQLSQPLQALTAIVSAALLIACANVANLLLARATTRRKEFAVRLALGASRWRLLRQVLTESILLSTFGGLLGLLFARWGGALLVSFFSSGRAQLFIDMPLDYRVLLFTSVAALLTGLLFGLAPALQAMRNEPNAALRESAGAVGPSRLRFGKVLVIGQVALSLVLLIGAGLFARTLHNLKTIDPGFRPEGVLTMRINPPDGAYEGERLAGLWQSVLARVERLPGVRSAALAAISPLSLEIRGVAIDVVDSPPGAVRDKGIGLNQISPGYFQTVGVPILLGRSFTDADIETSPKAALLNETAARHFFGDRSPLGAYVRFIRRDQPSPPYEIVGVVRDSRHRNLREADTRMMYVPITQARDRLGSLTLAMRAEGAPTELTNAINNELRGVGPDILLTNIVTLNEQIDKSLMQERLIATLSLFFGLLALLLACIGLYGVMNYDVVRRTNEIGIRMALGANANCVVRMVLRETLWWVALGLMLGLGAALATTRWMENLLFGLKPHDPLTIGLATLILLTVAAVAGYLPARRAARTDPLAALRSE
jgi:predicted permease